MAEEKKKKRKTSQKEKAPKKEARSEESPKKPEVSVSEKLKEIKERSRQISEELAKKIGVEEVAGKPPAREFAVQEKVPAEEAPEQKEEVQKEREKTAPPKPPAPKKPEPPPVEEKALPFREGIAQALASSRKRKFSQTWDLAINLKGIDLKKPENRFTAEFPLPEGRGRELRIGVIADSLAEPAKRAGADLVIRKEEIEPLGRDKKQLKKLANQVDWFYGEVTLMAQVGKTLGTVLGPRGKIPKPLPPNADVGTLLKRARGTVRVALRETPVIHVPIGAEGMKEEAILKNLEGVYTFVKEKLPKGVNNIRSAYLKLTMGKPVKLEVK